MKKPFLLILFSLFFSSLVASVQVDANFQNSNPAKYFKTDLQFQNNFRIFLPNGTELFANQVVCTGTSLTITPSINSKWATNTIDISTPYPAVETPPTLPSIPRNTGNIKWMQSSFISSLPLDFDESWNDPASQMHYNAIQPFVDQPVKYERRIGEFYNSQGGGSVLCSGSLAFNANGRSIGQINLASPSNINFMPSSGSTTITAELSGAACVAAFLKYPKDIAGVPNDQKYFYTYYFKGNAPSIPAAPFSFPITVQSGGGTCSVTKQGFSKDTKTIGADEYSLVNLQVRNDGTGTVKLLSVSDSSGTFTVYASDDMAVCAAFGSCSPTIIGTSMAPGETKTLLFYAKRNAGKTGDGNFVLTSQVDTGGCGIGDTCNLNFDLSVPTLSCEISPSTATMKSTETVRFTVLCKNTGAPTACTGDWSWEDGSGGFASKNSNEANATNSVKGAHNLRYSFAGVSCTSAVTVSSDDGKDKKNTCEITGPSVLYSGSTGSYSIKCINNLGANVTCPTVTWGGTATYKSQSNTGAVVEASTAGTFNIDARTTLDAKDISCTKPFDVVKGKCVYYS